VQERIERAIWPNIKVGREKQREQLLMEGSNEIERAKKKMKTSANCLN
jgi:hypothetical protein